MGRLLKRSWIPLITRIFTLFIFIFLIFLLSMDFFEFLSVRLSSKFGMFLMWTLWWPFLCLTIVLFGRAWCGFLCPISLANEVGNKFAKRKKTVLKLVFLPFLLFIFIVYFEQVLGLFLSVPLTLVLLIVSFALAFIFGVFFSGFSFCMFVCPVGTLLKVFSRLSILGVRSDKKICAKCKTFDCLKGTKSGKCPSFINIPENESNALCLMCTRCIKNCPYDSTKLRFIKPGDEIIKKRNFMIGESFFVIVLLAIETVLTTNGNLFYRKIFPIVLLGPLLRLVDFLVAIVFFLVLYLLASYLTSLLNKKIKLKVILKEYGYVYLPLAFFIMFFTITFGFLGPVLNLNEATGVMIKYASLFVGGLWSLFILFKFSKRILIAIPHLILIVGIVLFWLLYLIPGPLNIVEEEENLIVVEPGEVVEIDSYSMGYDPSLIIVQKGTLVKMKIKNKDIIHAFDIDEFDVHEVIDGGEETIVEFIPDKAGEFKVYCAIPGHEEAGMVAKLKVI